MTTTSKPTPELSGVVAHLAFEDANQAVALYQKAFGADVVTRIPAEDGKRLMHCHLRINNGDLFVMDVFPERGHGFKPHQGYLLHLTVPDANAWWKRAIDAGCTSLMDLHVAFWGDTYGQLRDPFGVIWSLSTPAAR